MKSFQDYLIEQVFSEGVADTIRDQIGNKALYMIGAKNLTKGKDRKGQSYIQFKIGRNSKSINTIRVTYNRGLDLYDISFGAIRKGEFKSKANHEGVYADMLKDLIEKETGLYTSL